MLLKPYELFDEELNQALQVCNNVHLQNIAILHIS